MLLASKIDASKKEKTNELIDRCIDLVRSSQPDITTHLEPRPANSSRVTSRLALCILYFFVPFVSVSFLLFLVLFLPPEAIFSSWGLTYMRPLRPLVLTKNYTVSLIGDSLIWEPWHHHDLLGKINILLPGNSLNILNFAEDGAQLLHIRNVLDGALAVNPDAVILLFDTDCLDERPKYTAAEIAQRRADYVKDMNYVIRTVLKTGSAMAVSGPIMLGEGPLFNPPKFNGRPLDFYRAMNRNMSNFYDIDYIDIRQKFVEAIPSYHIFFKWFLTEDGEHVNEHGARIIAQELSRWLLKWSDTTNKR